MQRDPWFRTLLILGIAFLSVQLFLVVWHFGGHFANTILIFFLAWMLSFILNPAVNILADRWVPGRPAAVAVVFIAMLALVALVGFLMIPPAVGVSREHRLPGGGRAELARSPPYRD